MDLHGSRLDSALSLNPAAAVFPADPKGGKGPQFLNTSKVTATASVTEGVAQSFPWEKQKKKGGEGRRNPRLQPSSARSPTPKHYRRTVNPVQFTRLRAQCRVQHLLRIRADARLTRYTTCLQSQPLTPACRTPRPPIAVTVSRIISDLINPSYWLVRRPLTYPCVLLEFLFLCPSTSLGCLPLLLTPSV